MKLHEDIKLFRQAIQATAQQMNIREIYIEKDYWVTYALFTIFNHSIGEETIFKGGTALSKCFDLIDRFSEDIDLVVLRKEGETDNQLKKKIRTISKVVGGVMPEVEIEGITHKMGMNRKTAHSYSKEFDGTFGQVRDVIILESTWLGYYEPYTQRNVSSLIYDMMVNNDQLKIAEDHGLLPFEVLVLEPRRTLCEKIMSLVRFSYSEEDTLGDLKKKIRHTYDLHLMLQDDAIKSFFESPDFDQMLLKVASDDVLSFRNYNHWLVHHPNEAMLFKELDTVWPQL